MDRKICIVLYIPSLYNFFYIKEELMRTNILAHKSNGYQSELNGFN